MAFELKITVSESCDGLNFVDYTGPYDATTNPTGYGGPDGPAGPGDYSSYIFSFWEAGLDPTTTDPTYTLGVTGNIPAADADGNYVWSVSLDALGLTVIGSGTAYVSAIALFGSIVYDPDCEVEFFLQVQGMFDTAMLKNGAPCDCGCKGCTDVIRMYSIYLATVCGGAYSGVKYQSNMDYFKAHLPTCC